MNINFKNVNRHIFNSKQLTRRELDFRSASH